VKEWQVMAHLNISGDIFRCISVTREKSFKQQEAF